MTLVCSGFYGCKQDDRQLEISRNQADSLSRELVQQREVNDSLRHLIEKNELAAGYPIFFGRKFDTISKPEEYISNALKQQKDKIPLDGVLGGTMEFRLVQVLTEDWVLAIYDDGHIQGKSIYEYELQNDGSIRFSEVVSQLPD
ncbi:hypothetical protein [Salinimicrobium xinjiangense]|uniref:hypothetical protein n=1 Tax=Salinimicrobium xinjiangense TaxID=438596 RepID=UPI00041C1817|nr:hypothetical protein [Salinimicrobium xinjiangense]